jgi:hypothetical protein
MLFVYVHDDESQAKARFETTAAKRGAAGQATYTFSDGDTAETGRVAGRLTLTVRLTGAEAAKLATSLLDNIPK